MNSLIPSLAVAGSAALCLTPGAFAQISFQPATNYGLQGQRPDWVATGDFDGDGDMDFAVTSGQAQGQNGPDFVEVFVNNGSGSFSAGQALIVGNNVSTAALVSGDLDGDGDTDLAVSLKDTNQVLTLVNNGGVFSNGSSVGVGGLEPRHMTGADLDGDGDMDLVASNRDSNNLSLLVNNGAGSFSLLGTLATGAEPRHVDLGDLNGDGTLDVAYAAHDARQVEYRLGTGGGAFGGIQSIPIPLNNKPSGMHVADLDGDGDMDMVSSTDQNDIGQIVVMTNAGAGSFSAVVFNTGGVNPDAVVTGDFDVDGDRDVATSDEAASFVSALPNIGGTSFGAGSNFGVGLHPSMLAAADFDGNGSLDLVTANRDSNNASVLLNSQSGGGGTINYCQTSANSFGPGALMGSSGSLSVAANSFGLSATGAPPGQPGIFYFGAGQTQVAFGNGFRCVAGQISRLLPPLSIDGAGNASRGVDFTTAPGNVITGGSVWNFQFWFRDPMGGAAQFNLSDGLNVSFLP